MRRYYSFIQLIAVCFLLATIFFSACNNNKKANTPQLLDINNVTVNLPNAKGVELVQGYCASCHSLRYIEIQPNLTKAAWKKIVKKMVGAYGCPIKDTNTVAQIIDYLATVKGKS
jgi:hypothetical protein